MKSAITNAFLLITALFAVILVSLSTPIGKVEIAVPLPPLSERHAYLNGLRDFSHEEYFELQRLDKEYAQKIEQRSQERMKQKEPFPSKHLLILFDRLQIVMMITIFMFSLFYRIYSYKDVVAILLAMVLLSFGVSLIQKDTLIYSILIVLGVSSIRIIYTKNQNDDKHITGQ